MRKITQRSHRGEVRGLLFDHCTWQQARVSDPIEKFHQSAQT